MASTLTNLLVHVVFSTKGRERLLGTDNEETIYRYIGGIIRGERGVMLKIGGTADHLHILCKLPASSSLADLIRKVKANSSKWINEQPWCTFRFSWQRGYGAFSVSQSMVGPVMAYIGEQKEHHKNRGFKEEFVELLEKHDIEYDPRYLFED